MHGIDLTSPAIGDCCRRWKIVKLEIFGSLLRDDVGSNREVHFLVTFDPQARWGLFDLVDVEEDLSAVVGRPVDLVERPPLEASHNWIRRKAILEGAQTIYVT